MSIIQTKAERLEELLGIELPNEQQLAEIQQLKIDLHFPEEREEEESIGPIKHNREQFIDDRRKEEEYAVLKAERRRLEVRAGIIREKKRIEELKHELDGEVWCDDCHIWVDPSHFD